MWAVRGAKTYMVPKGVGINQDGHVKADWLGSLKEGALKPAAYP